MVDLWGGYRDIERRAPWEEDTLVPVGRPSRESAARCANPWPEEAVSPIRTTRYHEESPLVPSPALRAWTIAWERSDTCSLVKMLET